MDCDSQFDAKIRKDSNSKLIISLIDNAPNKKKRKI